MLATKLLVTTVGNDKGIDLFHVDDEFSRVVVGQGRFNKAGKYGPRTGELFELIHTSDWLEDPEGLRREGRPDLAAAAEQYLEAIAKGYSVEFSFVYTGPAKKEVEDAAAKFTQQELGATPSKAARVLHLQQLQNVHLEYIDKSSRIAAAAVQISTGSFEQNGPFGKALVTSIPGVEVRRLYE